MSKTLKITVEFTVTGVCHHTDELAAQALKLTLEDLLRSDLQACRAVPNFLHAMGVFHDVEVVEVKSIGKKRTETIDVRQ